MAMSPTQLSIRHLKENGYLVAVVEKWNPFVKIRQDLFGFIDVLAIRENETLAVQVTSAANMKARLRKIEDIETLPKVRDANWSCLLYTSPSPRDRQKSRMPSSA